MDINFGFDFTGMEDVDIIEIFDSFEDVDIVDDSGNTFLLWACKVFNQNLVSYALERGANPNYLNDSGETPVQEIIDTSEDKEDLAIAILQQLIDAGADLELRAYMDKTAFLKACSRNSIRVIELLVNNGANTHAVVEEGGKLLNGNFYANIFSKTEEIRNCIERYVNS